MIIPRFNYFPISSIFPDQRMGCNNIGEEDNLPQGAFLRLFKRVSYNFITTRNLYMKSEKIRPHPLNPLFYFHKVCLLAFWCDFLIINLFP